MADELSLVYDKPLHCTVTHPRAEQTIECDVAREGGVAECFGPLDLVAAAVGT